MFKKIIKNAISDEIELIRQQYEKQIKDLKDKYNNEINKLKDENLELQRNNVYLNELNNTCYDVMNKRYEESKGVTVNQQRLINIMQQTFLEYYGDNKRDFRGRSKEGADNWIERNMQDFKYIQNKETKTISNKYNNKFINLEEYNIKF